MVQRYVICKCGRIGRRERDIAFNRFSYPIDTVPVPTWQAIHLISDAWEYASKVCLRMSQRVMKEKPFEPELDERLANGIYSNARLVIAHSDEDIAQFENRHSKIIQQRLESAGISPPQPRVPRLSLALLYYAIVCKRMADMFKDVNSPPKEPEKQREVAFMIYTHYSGVFIDERAKTPWLGWLQIALAAHRGGSRAGVEKSEEVARGKKLSKMQIEKKLPEVLAKAEAINKYRRTLNSYS